MHPERYPGYVDPRHCLVFWARPPSHLRLLVDLVQKKLREMKPGLCFDAFMGCMLNIVDLWFMPLECLHMTALEVAHSLTESEIGELLRIMEPTVSKITDYSFDHRARLIKPLLSYDNQAIALSFLPASDETMSDAIDGNADSYTYHHLRRDLYDLCKRTGVDVGSRYVVPSAHLTLARFVTERNPGGDDEGQISSSSAEMIKWTNQLEEINSWLKEQYWPESRSATTAEGEWVVGDERGLECRAGTVWYGGGRSVHVGRGFTVSRLEYDEYRV